jgi:hypothetical protein
VALAATTLGDAARRGEIEMPRVEADQLAIEGDVRSPPVGRFMSWMASRIARAGRPPRR